MQAKENAYRLIRNIVCISVLMLGAVIPDYGQYFGRNKARYRSFDFEVVQSPHFEFYHYTNDSSIRHLINLSERWYRIHQATFEDTIRFKNPVIFYNNHAEFQQTAAIGGIISVGTGGVTEGLKNRVVMPMMETWAQTDHVLGHELVHAFQYNLLRNENDSLSLKNMQYVPLWMIEGLAEYLSIGRKDPHTAMWMRDAVLHDDVPTIKELTTSGKYFPYRYGHAFWAFIGGVWGDSTVIDLYKNVIRYGPEAGIDSTLAMSSKTLSVLWKQGVKNYYSGFLKDSTDHLTGKLLVDEKWGGYMNISPSISPNGRYVAFLSEKDLFGIDLYLADLETGKILRKISSSTGRNAHIDALSFIESSGTWSPDGGSYAYVIFDKGKNMLMVTDLWSGRNERRIEIPGIESISNPSWSPWGNKIAFTGIKNGRSDLFLYDLGSREVEQLTNDPYSDIQPSWSPDGRYLVFSTDRKSFEKGKSYAFNLCIIDLLKKERTDLPVFPGADNLNPRYSNLNDIVFLSNRDGYRNLYEYDISNNLVTQLTDYMTGISGITPFAPAMDVSSKNETVVYTYYSKGKYSIYSAPLEDFNRKPLKLTDVDMTPAFLVPGTQNAAGMVVQETIDGLNQFEETPGDSLSRKPYRGKFKLDYVGNTGVGVAYGSHGLGMAGGVNMLFGDMLGNNQLFAALMVNGEVYDFGGQVAYFNQKKRLGWGASLSHIPYRLDYIGYGIEELPVSNDSSIVVENWSQQVVRIFEDQASLFAYYPFSTTRRLEWSGSYSYFSYRIDQFNNYYYRGWYIGQNREKLDPPDPYGLWRNSVAFVGDNASFGIASPMKGHRFRLDYTQYGGELHYSGLLADIRQYFYLKPFSLAFRGYFYGRYGRDITSQRISPLFVGHSMLVRGYDDVMFANSIGNNSKGINQLYGNKILVGNVELRFPLTGPKRLTPFESKFFFTELAFFIDAGTTWDTPPAFSGIETGNGNGKPFSDYIISSGISARINLFGQVVLEPYYAVPYQRSDLNGKQGVFGLNFWPGW